MGWYNDKAINTIDAKLALEGAGAGAKAFSTLAKIPLDIDDRKMKQQEIDDATYIAKLKSNTALTVAEKRSAWETYKANRSVDGRKITAAASYNRADADKQIEGSRSKTAAAERENKIDVQKLKNKGGDKKPSKEIKYDGTNKTTTYKNLGIDDKIPLTDAEKKKHTSSEIAKKLGWYR